MSAKKAWMLAGALKENRRNHIQNTLYLYDHPNKDYEPIYILTAAEYEAQREVMREARDILNEHQHAIGDHYAYRLLAKLNELLKEVECD